MISRLTPQKGFDLIENIFAALMERQVQFVVLGTGEPRYEDFFRAAAARYPEQVAARIGFDEPLAHQIEAGADLFLMPSLYEPCGLNQMFSLKYGTIPIVRAVGGLKDTVQHYDARRRNRHGLCFRALHGVSFARRRGSKLGGLSQQEGMERASAPRHGDGFFLGPFGEALCRLVPATCQLRGELNKRSMMYVLGVIMAGGRGERLYPLTQHRAKPAVPFGGRYRIIDFVLSNFINSGILSIYVVTQFKAQSLLEHLDRGWRTTDFLGEHFVTPVPAQMRSGEDWYQGTADCVYQNLYLLERHNPKLVAVFGADHIYRMNVRQMIDEHQKKSADVTVAALPVKIEEASQFGVIKVDADWRIIGFDEKPKNPKSIPGRAELCLGVDGQLSFQQ